MSTIDRREHWESVYRTRDEKEVSWFEESPTISVDLIRSTGVNASASIVDIGGGASRLVDALLHEGFTALTILDLSESALAMAKARLGALGTSVRWVAADVTTWEPSESYDVWHDRAALHFLIEPKDRLAYAKRLSRAVRSGGHVIIGTFAPDGPERCSGLQVARYDGASLCELLGSEFELAESRRHAHQTPMGATQWFQFSRFRRTK